ncbi:MAG: HlyD family secretion protein [Planctomycetota bacterium]|jgi:HlyD family secretion protein
MTANKKKKRSPLWTFVIVLVAAGAALVWAQREGLLFVEEEGNEIAGAVVRRGPLEITVTERGNLTAKNSVSIKSEVEGRATLLFLIDEGTQVQPGDLLAEIDTADQVDNRVAQEISVQTARAAATKAREGLEIQRIENESLIAKAEQDVAFARLDLERFIGADVAGLEGLEFDEVRAHIEGEEPNPIDGTDELVDGDEVGDEDAGFSGGNRRQELQQHRDDVLIREEERQRAKDRLNWSSKLAEKGFVERSELEADKLAYTRAGIMLEQADRAFYLLEKYEHPKTWTTLQGDFREAERQLRKAKKQTVALLADFEAAKETTKVKLSLEEEKLVRILDQIAKGKLYAPVAGMVVYGQTEGGRMSGGEPVQEGGEVRERQEIVTIPGDGGMVAEASVHESVLKQVVTDLPVILRIDAIPDREFNGHISNVAVLPDKNSWWANPNLRLYKTEVVVEEVEADMRPGMSCSIEILVESIPDTLYVPVQSVYHSGGNTLCWVQSGKDIEERTVEIGSHNQTWLEIKSGLSEGEIVLLSPPLGFLAVEEAPEADPDADADTESAPVSESATPSPVMDASSGKSDRGKSDRGKGQSGKRPESQN